MTQNNTQTNEEIAESLVKELNDCIVLSDSGGDSGQWSECLHEDAYKLIKEALDTKDLKITSLEAQIEGFKIMKDESEYMRGYHAGEVYAFGTCDGYLAQITSLEESLRKAKEALRPFADKYNSSTNNEFTCDHEVTHAQLRLAKSTLSEIEKDISK